MPLNTCKAANIIPFFHSLQTYPPFGSAVSQKPLQWPHHHVGAPPQWEQSQGWAGPTSNSLRSIHPQLPAAACIGGALPGTAALERKLVEERAH